MSAKPGVPRYETLERAWGIGCWEYSGGQGAGNAVGHRVLELGHKFPGEMNPTEQSVPKSLTGDFILELLSAGPHLLHSSHLKNSPVLQQMATRKHAQLCFPEPS